MNPIDAVLIAKGPCFALPGASCQIGFDLLIREWVHHERSEICVKELRIIGPPPKTQAANDPVLASPKALEHASGILPAAWLAEDLALAFGHRIATDDNAGRDLPR